MSATTSTPLAAPRGPSFAERSATFLKACFAGPVNSALTLACIAVLYFAVPPFWAWAVTNATLFGTAQDCRAAGGACWAFVRELSLIHI